MHSMMRRGVRILFAFVLISAICISANTNISYGEIKTITLNAVGGTFKDTGEEIKEYDVSFTDDTGMMETADFPEPEREGYAFLGWAYYVGAPMPGSYVSKDTDQLYAFWKKNNDPMPYGCKISYFDKVSNTEIADFSVNIGKGISLTLPSSYDREKGIKLEGYYPDGSSFEKDITVFEDGVWYCSVESESIDKTEKQTYIISVVERDDALRTIDFEGIVGIQLADPESVDESGYPTRTIVIPVMISEAVSENGAEVELPYGVLDKGWKVNIFWELNFEGAGINVGDGYSMVGKKDISADLRNSLQKKYVFRDSDGTEHDFVLNFTESDGSSTELNDLAFLFWDGESYDETGDKLYDALSVDLEAAMTSKGAEIVLPYYYDKERCGSILTGLNDPENFAEVSGLEESYDLDGNGKCTVEFTVTSANGKNTQKYKITIVKDRDGSSTELEALQLLYGDIYMIEEDQYVPVDIEAAKTEAGAHVTAPVNKSAKDVRFNLYAETRNFATVDDKGNTSLIWEPDIYKRPEAYNKTSDTLEFTVTSANGKNTQKYKVTVWQKGAQEETDISTLKITGIADKEYTGSDIEQDIVITDGDKILTAGVDYILKYENNRKVGQATVTISGQGSYTGTVIKNFKIYKKDSGSSDAFDKISGGKSMIRIAGDNRYATSTAAADALKQSLDVDKFENIIVASGDDYPDALAGSYLAKVKNAPVMLVGKDANTEVDVKQYINKNLKKGGTVYLLGGTGVVTSRFEKSLGDLKVERLGGQTRYETNIAILKAAGVDKEDLLVCTGEGFADSLSASAVGKPILLVAGSGVDDTQKKYLGSLKINDIYLIGGTGVVSEKIGTQLKKYDQDDKCERVAGQNRYLTSVAVAKEFFPKGSDSAVLAYAMNFPDGLAGGPLALSIKAPLILTDNSGYSEAVAYAKNAGIHKAAVLGGPTLISDGVVKAIIN